jgi:hypothetical protein
MKLAARLLATFVLTISALWANYYYPFLPSTPCSMSQYFGLGQPGSLTCSAQGYDNDDDGDYLYTDNVSCPAYTTGCLYGGIALESDSSASGGSIACHSEATPDIGGDYNLYESCDPDAGCSSTGSANGPC